MTVEAAQQEAAELVKRLQKLTGWSLTEIARRVQVSPMQISRIARKQTLATRALLERIDEWVLAAGIVCNMTGASIYDDLWTAPMKTRTKFTNECEAFDRLFHKGCPEARAILYAVGHARIETYVKKNGLPWSWNENALSPEEESRWEGASDA